MKPTLPLVHLGIFAMGVAANGADSFVNFETSPVHPVALSADARTLAVCNLPDNRVLLFDVASGIPAPVGEVPVGLDPVSVRFRAANELWVVNHISRSISIVDVARQQVTATLETLPGPADVVFAGSPARAFVTCTWDNTVQVFDPVTRQAITNIVLAGDRPKALAVSPDGGRVYAAIFESGNASTILAPPLTPIGVNPEYSVVSDPAGPYGGQDPPPNAGNDFNPPRNPDLSGDYEAFLPRGRLIVKKSAAGRWMDDNAGDWTEFVSGTNASRSGRPVGWDMPDRDLAVIDTATFAVTYATGLMNLCMGVAVNPASGRIAVIGTDAANEHRFEPNLQSTFLRVNLALVDPATLEKTIVDLNPHLDYHVRRVPPAERDKSLGDPRGIVWNAAGTRAYVTGMGSRNLVVIDAQGNRVAPLPVELGEGPAGLALDEGRGRLYVLNRFSATLSVLDTTSLAVITNVPFFDPTPPAVRAGRRHLYDTRSNSGLGQAACASCHPDARFDRLAWDLGNPAGEMIFRPRFGNPTNDRIYHPMKGPMVTQTLQDMLGIRHWRGDRSGIEDFNVTFPDLLGRDSPLAADEMQELKSFLQTIRFPPNRFRNLDNTFPTNLALPGHRGLDGAGELSETPLPNGNATNGLAIFRERRFFTGDVFNLGGGGELTQRCDLCHNGESGNGLEVDVLFLPRNAGLAFKGTQLRSLADKAGMDTLGASSRAGFGFLHDGRVDTLTRLLAEGLEFTDNQEIADVIAFLLSFSGTGVRTGSDGDHDSRDVPSGVGRQFTMAKPGTNALLQTMLALAERRGFAPDSPVLQVDLVARGTQAGLNRGWFYDPETQRFQADRNHEDLSVGALLALAGAEAPLTFTLTPLGSGRRIGIDRDGDGYADRTELEHGFDPRDPLSQGTNAAPRFEYAPPYFEGLPELRTHAGRPATVQLTATDADLPAQTLAFRLTDDAPAGAGIAAESGAFVWTPPLGHPAGTVRIAVRVTDNGTPPLSHAAALKVMVVPLRVFELYRGREGDVRLTWDAVPGSRYRVQFKHRPDDGDWNDLAGDIAPGAGVLAAEKWDYTATAAAQRFYQVVLLD